jgi:hypothetical protein
MRTAKEKAIHQQMIDYVNNSGLTVEVVEIYGTVAIKERDGSTLVYLQGEEGSNFITEARRNWNKFEDITQAEANELQAYQYADMERS